MKCFLPIRVQYHLSRINLSPSDLNDYYAVSLKAQVSLAVIFVPSVMWRRPSLSEAPNSFRRAVGWANQSDQARVVFRGLSAALLKLAQVVECSQWRLRSIDPLPIVWRRQAASFQPCRINTLQKCLTHSQMWLTWKCKYAAASLFMLQDYSQIRPIQRKQVPYFWDFCLIILRSTGAL